jgi:hypothetical protein
MPTSSPKILSPTTTSSETRHEFAYPRVRQIAPRAHTVLASSLHPRGPGAPVLSR